ncbi:LLM class flavin-dependent oxidoreductase [Streptomyces sp. NPDC093261]|uniref:LLM class flavin-dependent oxidoreductase n=1 Tax=Streptomyces sp. NPDC093261 TaxID=3366037 RepID=UPI0038159E88
MTSPCRARPSGEFWQLSDAAMEPKPFQKPHPPLWFGGSGRTALRRAVMNPDLFGAGQVPTRKLAEQARIVRQALAECGRPAPDTRNHPAGGTGGRPGRHPCGGGGRAGPGDGRAPAARHPRGRRRRPTGTDRAAPSEALLAQRLVFPVIDTRVPRQRISVGRGRAGQGPRGRAGHGPHRPEPRPDSGGPGFSLCGQHECPCQSS